MSMLNTMSEQSHKGMIGKVTSRLKLIGEGIASFVIEAVICVVATLMICALLWLVGVDVDPPSKSELAFEHLQSAVSAEQEFYQRHGQYQSDAQQLQLDAPDGYTLQIEEIEPALIELTVEVGPDLRDEGDSWSATLRTGEVIDKSCQPNWAFGCKEGTYLLDQEAVAPEQIAQPDATEPTLKTDLLPSGN